MPIRKLVVGTKLLAKGDRTFRIESNSKDEIGELATSFNNMTSQLEDSEKQLQDYAHNLEREVKDKTKEIRREKKYTENMIEMAQDAIISIDENGIVNIWNQSAEKIFGYSKGEIIGQPITTIIPENYQKQHEDGMQRFLQNGKTRIMGKTVTVAGKTNESIEIPIEMSLSFQKIEDERYIFTAIIRDITLQYAAKKQLVAKAKELEIVNSELEDFIYITSHDLKEPLFVISGYSAKLSRHNDDLNEKAKFYVNRIKSNVEMMSDKINDVMEVLKVGRVTYNFKNNDSRMIVKDVLEILESKIKLNKVNVQIQGNLPSVLCDKERLKDVFLNLISNAIKFTHNDNRIKIGGVRDSDYYKFIVEDTGIGIRKEYQKQIFKVFRRLNDVETEGTGVGLAIVKKIVEMHNGNIWVESHISNEKGSRFCFTIPLVKQNHIQGDRDIQN